MIKRRLLILATGALLLLFGAGCVAAPQDATLNTAAPAGGDASVAVTQTTDAKRKQLNSPARPAPRRPYSTRMRCRNPFRL